MKKTSFYMERSPVPLLLVAFAVVEVFIDENICDKLLDVITTIVIITNV
jgi:hypothetical protein